MRTGAFVLHLTRAAKRRPNALRLIDDCGLEGELWPAVDGSKLTPDEVTAAYRDHLFDPPYPFPLKLGEVGCFISHRQIWAEIVRRDLDHALVFEDDVALDKDQFQQALTLARDHIGDLDFIEFQNRPPEGKTQPIGQSGGCVLSLPEVTPLRLSAEMISRRAAERLLEFSAPFDRPADTYVQCHWHTSLQPAVIYPSGVSTISDQLDGSTIQASKKSLGERIHREIGRFRYRRAVDRFSRQNPGPAQDRTK